MDLYSVPDYSEAVQDETPLRKSKTKEVTRNETCRSHLRAVHCVRGSGRSFSIPLVDPRGPQPPIGDRQQPGAAVRAWIAYLPGLGTCPVNVSNSPKVSSGQAFLSL